MVTDTESTSMKGIKSAAGVQILGGSFTIDAADDALHSDVSMTICGGSSGGSITISGGVLTIQADGDGLDANGTIEITGGTTTVAGPTQGDTATLDYDTTATIGGGVFIGTGAQNMAQTFSDPQQGTLAVRVGSQSAGTQVLIADGDQELICFTPSMDFQVVIVSMPELVSGKRYTLTVGSQSAQIEAM